MAKLIQNSLFIQLVQTEQNDQQGCLPTIEFRMQGTIPSGAELVANFNKEDGSSACELRFDLQEAAEEDYTDIRPYLAESKTLITEAGIYPFQFRVVSELEGVDELLHEGKIRVKTYDGGRRGQQFALDADWTLPCAHLWLDVNSDNDAPPLFVSYWLKGKMDAYETAAYLFYNGKKIMSSENRDQASVSNMKTLESDDENFQYQYFVAEFSITKAYLNCEYGNMDGWHNLSLNPGDYEIKIAATKKLVRVIPFKVGDDGRIEAPGMVEQNGFGNYVMQLTAEVKPGVEPAADTSVYPAELYFGGADQNTGSSIDDIYEYFPGLESNETSDAGEKLNQKVETALNEIIDNLRKNYRWYYEDLKAGGENLEHAQIEHLLDTLKALLPSFEDLMTKIPNDYKIEFIDEHISINKVEGYIKEMIKMASGIIHQEQYDANAKMAPYESVLKNDKLRICLDRPPHEYQYYTSKKKSIETPEQLASAKSWYFEGGYEEGGDLLKVTMWTVKGFTFDDEDNLLEEYENSGVGRKAPSSAFP